MRDKIEDYDGVEPGTIVQIEGDDREVPVESISESDGVIWIEGWHEDIEVPSGTPIFTIGYQDPWSP